ncbi:hypothetical protein HDU78_006324 [Chytriomyces hyalinus]|nr:hypothetical protein HDU78_011765 [Chytriomyces hyalinus]KAJ3222846.1 hypothetical protein HDU78_011558 [Chytriomyces hyalinus]KAJ3222962.1 hypothetical protein HDU78_011511 [Chytriomyces hyalinus]KAJ3233698.1 hypothetical protein HDU78_006324 [Chytriomyces hyalinus]
MDDELANAMTMEEKMNGKVRNFMKLHELFGSRENIQPSAARELILVENDDAPTDSRSSNDSISPSEDDETGGDFAGDESSGSMESGSVEMTSTVTEAGGEPAEDEELSNPASTSSLPKKTSRKRRRASVPSDDTVNQTLSTKASLPKKSDFATTYAAAQVPKLDLMKIQIAAANKFREDELQLKKEELELLALEIENAQAGRKEELKQQKLERENARLAKEQELRQQKSRDKSVMIVSLIQAGMSLTEATSAATATFGA